MAALLLIQGARATIVLAMRTPATRQLVPWVLIVSVLLVSGPLLRADAAQDGRKTGAGAAPPSVAGAAPAMLWGDHSRVPRSAPAFF